MSVLFDDGLVSTGGYEIANSLMFRGAQYLSRTPVVAGNRKVWTYAFKFRRGTFVIGPFLTVGAGYPGGAIGLDTGDVLSFWEYTGSGFNLKLVTTQVFRDPSAWYDVVIAFDSTQAVSTDRVKIWVNGVRVTAFTTATYPAQNYDSYFNNANIHKIGTGMGAGNLDGYVAEPIFVDGLALDPSYFGKFDTVTGQWVAKKYTGTFGTNGFCLDFKNAAYAGFNKVNSELHDKVVAVNSTNAAFASNTLIHFLSSQPQSGYLCYSTNGYENDWSIGYDFSTSVTLDKITVRGHASTEIPRYALIERWDGSAWVKVPVTGWLDGASAYNADEFQLANSSTTSSTVTFAQASGTKFRVRFTQSWNVGDLNAGINRLVMYSGSLSTESNDLLPSGFSASDVVLDTPSNTYVTMNPLATHPNCVLSNGNRVVTLSTTGTHAWYGAWGNTAWPSSGKYRFRVKYISGNWLYVGLWRGQPINWTSINSENGTSTYMPIHVQLRVNGTTTYLVVNGAYGAATPTINSGDWVEFIFDKGAGTLAFYVNSTLIYSASGVSVPGELYPVFAADAGVPGSAAVCSAEFDFGQSGYSSNDSTAKSLCTKNLPEPSIKKGSSGFNAVTWTGNGTTKSITGVGHQPDLVWLKRRDAAAGHILQDSVRGTYRYLNVNSTDPENTNPLSDWFQSFDSDGFTVKYQSSGGVNTNEFDFNGGSYVGWSWKKGAAYGLDIVTYTGTGSNSTVPHSLGVAPAMVITKGRSGAGAAEWVVWHKALGAVTNTLVLNSTSAQASGTTYFNGSHTASTLGIGTGTSSNANGSTYVGYCFADVEGFSKFGSYTGNGSADGPFVYCGFKPRWIMVKRTDAAGDWQIIDTNRDAFNASTNDLLWSNLSNASSVSYKVLDAMSNGFKLKDATTPWNASGGTYIYACFAECPTKFATAR